MTTDNNPRQRPRIDIPRVGELTSAILLSRTTKGRFRLDIPLQDAIDLLAAFFNAEVMCRCRKTEWDENTKKAIISLAEHLTLPAPKFGIMCCGTCGNGKTTLMLAFQQLLRYLGDSGALNDTPYKSGMEIYDVKDLLWYAKTDYKKLKGIMQSPMMGIDDLGKEPVEVLDYGNVLSPIVDILEYRYSRQLFTFMTTNLTGRGRADAQGKQDGSIRGKYGARIADRFNEMFHTIIFKDISYREQ